MLFRKNLRRRHDTGLEPVVECNQHAHECHECLPASHVALQQPVHLPTAPHVTAYLANHTFLSTGELKGQLFLIKAME